MCISSTSGRTRRRRGSIGWVSQDLLRIVHSNWPKLIEKSVLNGVLWCRFDGRADASAEGQERQLRDEHRRQGRRGPLLFGTAGDGSSMLCTMLASRLMNELRHHAEVLRNEEVRHAVVQDMRSRGVDMESTLEFELVLLEDLTPTPELLAVLTDERCISRGSLSERFRHRRQKYEIAHRNPRQSRLSTSLYTITRPSVGDIPYRRILSQRTTLNGED